MQSHAFSVDTHRRRRQKSAHHHEVTYFPCDASVPLELRWAIYTRLSDDDAESVSHDQQIEADRKFAGEHGAVVVALYQDWRTGFDPSRLAFKQMLLDAHSGMHGAVVFYDHTRFHRGITGAGPVFTFHQRMPSYRYHATTGGYDIQQIAIWAGLSQMEADTTRRRSIEQRRHRAQRGQWMAGNKPYWLEREPLTKAAVIVPERATAILDAMKLYARGMHMRQVAAWMTEHAPVASGRPERWSASRLRNAFRNPALWGELDYARSKVEVEWLGDEQVVVGRGINPDAIPFKVPALIHKSAVERLECETTGGCERDAYPSGKELDELIAGNLRQASGRPGRLEHPLRQRVVCPCGWRMSFRAKTYRGRVYDYGYLTCARTKQRGLSVVKDYPPCVLGPGVSTRVLWPKTRTMFLAAVADPDEVIRQVERNLLAAVATEIRSQAEDALSLAQIAETLARLDAQEVRLYKNWDAGDITRVVYKGMISELADERRIAEEAKRQVLSRQRVLEQAAVATSVLRVALVGLDAEMLEAQSLAEWAQLFDRLVMNVYLDEAGNPSIEWRR